MNNPYLPPPSWCCPRCRAEIGWIDRGMEAAFGRLGYIAHDCPQPPENLFREMAGHASTIYRLTVTSFLGTPRGRQS